MQSLRSGRPSAFEVQPTSSNFGPPDTANLWQSSCWSSPSTFTQNVPTCRIEGHVVEDFDGQNSTNGGSRERAEKDWAVKPIGPRASAQVTMTSPVAKWPRTDRNEVGSVDGCSPSSSPDVPPGLMGALSPTQPSRPRSGIFWRLSSHGHRRV